MFAAHGTGFVGKRRYSRVDLLALFELQLGQAVALLGKSFLAGLRGVFPLVDVQTGSRGTSVKDDTILSYTMEVSAADRGAGDTAGV